MIALIARVAQEFSRDSERQSFNDSQDELPEEGRMVTYAISVTRSKVSAWAFLIVGLVVLSMNAVAAEVEEQGRLSVSTQSTRAERDKGFPGKTSEDEFEALERAGDRVAAKGSLSRSKPVMQTMQAANADFWFYTADIELFNDHDRDGYYHGIDLLFDADTYYAIADVYAVVYLSLDGGPWNEYAATEDFTLFGASSEDDYVIATELLAGYPSGSYDVLVELFDAYDNTFLAYFGPNDTSELAFLPLEDAGRDVADVPDVTVVNHQHGGGSTGAAFILVLALVVLRRLRGVLYA
ncbi:MAG: hypothetical protein GQ577_09975 [Woeseiaceae bacterium]|nr:hypothetical protein [Woeseiaceae bacterium]